jgi:outer membrane protein OmpA-like peptidoglycan-associated protein
MDSRRLRPIAMLSGLWAVLLVAGIIWASVRVEPDIEDRTAGAVAEYEVAVEVEGRDVTLVGEFDADADALARGVYGVRTVRWSGPDLAGGATTPPTNPSTTTTPPTNPSSTTTSPPTTSPPPPTTVVAAGSFRASLTDGRLTLSGGVPSAEVRAGIAQVADLIYAPLITDEMVEDQTAPGGDWLAGLPRAVSVLPIAGNAAFAIDGDTIVITGTAGSEAKRGLLEGALRQALGDGFSYDNRVEVTGLAPPQFFARADGDGTVALSGAMPDQAAIDLIAGAAAEYYGAENVDNQMSVDSGREATFSVFRIPYIFDPLSLVPQWEVNIENDVITGGLRGGASFEYDSAELTPQLQQLATIAAGIIARNPTVAATIEGHTDSDGPAAYNQNLSQRRADAARDFIIALGVAPERLTAIGFGETSPMADNSTAAGRAVNRRIEFALGPIQGGS